LRIKEHETHLTLQEHDEDDEDDECECIGWYNESDIWRGYLFSVHTIFWKLQISK